MSQQIMLKESRSIRFVMHLRMRMERGYISDHLANNPTVRIMHVLCPQSNSHEVSNWIDKRHVNSSLSQIHRGRCLPVEMNSENGTIFIGANNELIELDIFIINKKNKLKCCRYSMEISSSSFTSYGWSLGSRGMFCKKSY